MENMLKPNKLIKSTNQLIIGLKNSDEKSFVYLYKNYSTKLFGVALSITHNTEIAEDVLQETFLKVFTNIERYDRTKGTFFTWMLNICRNGSIDKIRYGSDRIIISFDTIEFDESSKTDPHIDLVNKELWRLLKSLSTDHKQVLELSYYYGYSHRQISKKLNIPFGTVKSKIRIAVRELRKIYS